MANTAVMGAIGFLSWVLIARLYSAEDIGLASVLITLFTLIGGLSLLGLNIGLIRYLPQSKQKSETISTVFFITGATTIIFSVLFILLIPFIAPQLTFLKEDAFLSYLFIISVFFMTLFGVIEPVFLAFRRAEWVLVKGTIFSIGKLILPLFFVSLGAIGIFGAWSLSAAVAFLFAFYILVSRFNYLWTIHWHPRIFRKMVKFSFTNYVIEYIPALPTFLLPLLLTHLLGPVATGHYYVVMQLALLLFIVPLATSQSLFAESSVTPRHLWRHVRKASVITGIILIPLVILFFLFGNWFLAIFGEEYAVEGFGFLRLLALASIFTAVSGVLGNALRVQNRLIFLTIARIFGAIIILLLAFLFVQSGYALTGIGYAWIIGQAVDAFLCVIFSVYIYRESASKKTRARTVIYRGE
jgi:O-antigen/teichoic acid export membrane protein